jgi:hypothetical protein
MLSAATGTTAAAYEMHHGRFFPTLLLPCRVRWTVSGVPRLSMLGGDQALSTEVISTYTFDSQGKIYEHQVGRWDKV